MKSMIHLSLIFCICLSTISCSRPTNTPGPLSTESSSTVSSLSSTDTSSGTTSKDSVHYENMEIVSEGVVWVVSEKSHDSKVIETINKGEVYRILRQEVDGRGNLWYQIEMYVNAIGWVLATDCQKTDQAVPIPVRSAPGELLNPLIDKDLLLKFLAIRDRKIESFISVLGDEFTKTVNESDALGGHVKITEIFYRFQNGVRIECDDELNVECFDIGEDTYYLENNIKVTGNITSDPGDEILYYNHVDNFGELLVVKSDSATVIGNYRFVCTDEEWLRVGDFCGDGSNQIFYGQENEDYYDDYYSPNLSLLFTIGSDGSLTAVLDNNFLYNHLRDAKASIKDKMLTLDIDVGEYDFLQTRRLPDQIFNNNKYFPDKNAQLHKIIKWDVDPVDSKWYIVVDCIVFFDMVDGYWGLLMPSDPSPLINDLARTRFVFEIVDGNLVFRDADTVMKYPDSSQSDVMLVAHKELILGNGIFLRQKMEEAFPMLPDAPVTYVEFDHIKTADGVTLIAEDYLVDIPEVADIIVTNPKYPTMRGIRVGDTVEEVERLYGKPHQGLPGDEEAWYYESFEHDGDILTSYSEGIVFLYKDGKVASYHLYEYYRD